MTYGWWRAAGHWVGGKRRHRLVFLAVCWLCEAGLCIVLSRTDERFITPVGEASYESVRTGDPQKQTGHFFVRRLDGHYRPAFYLGWRNLSAENGRLGIFKTPLHKTLAIEDLEIRLHHYSRLDTDRGDQASLTQAVRGLEGGLGRGVAGLTMQGPLAEVNRATKVIVRGLDYRLFQDDRLDLRVQCRSAVVSTSATEVTLRGGVRIHAADGSRLMSNCVLWDVERNRFSVPGTYMLDRGGTPVSGRGLRCDHRLSIPVAHDVYDRKGENRWMGDPSF